MFAPLSPRNFRPLNTAFKQKLSGGKNILRLDLFAGHFVFFIHTAQGCAPNEVPAFQRD